MRASGAKIPDYLDMLYEDRDCRCPPRERREDEAHSTNQEHLFTVANCALKCGSSVAKKTAAQRRRIVDLFPQTKTMPSSGVPSTRKNPWRRNQ
jgi:hypothetical protein